MAALPPAPAAALRLRPEEASPGAAALQRVAALPPAPAAALRQTESAERPSGLEELKGSLAGLEENNADGLADLVLEQLLPEISRRIDLERVRFRFDPSTFIEHVVQGDLEGGDWWAHGHFNNRRQLGVVMHLDRSPNERIRGVDKILIEPAVSVFTPGDRWHLYGGNYIDLDKRLNRVDEQILPFLLQAATDLAMESSGDLEAAIEQAKRETTFPPDLLVGATAPGWQGVYQQLHPGMMEGRLERELSLGAGRYRQLIPFRRVDKFPELAAGLEGVTAEGVRQATAELMAKIQEPLAAIDAQLEWLKDLPEEDLQVQEGMRIIYDNGSRIVSAVDDLPVSVYGLTASHELNNALSGVIDPASRYLEQVDRTDLERDVEGIADAIRQIHTLLEELSSLPVLRLRVYGSSSVMQVLSLASSTSTQPIWIDPTRTRLLGNYGAGLVDEVERMEQAARKSGSDQLLLVPITPIGGEVIRLQPFFHREIDSEGQVRRYLAEGNRILKDFGIRFGELTPAPPGPLSRLGFLIYEGELPEGLAPEGYPAFQADRLSLENPDRFHPALVAMKTLHPRLPWEFLKGYQVKALLLLEDKLTKARYLAILA
ncbi:MAG: hypothetical protein HYZ90_03145 [Candidatus Omnitrophica bacterium]|nr:hypothetical protein [Candidatus Omnitrophota bacterium]